MTCNILKGPKRNFEEIDQGFSEYFFAQADIYSDKIFQIDGETEKIETYRDVKRRSTRVAIHLKKLGIKPKDIVLLCCKNNLDNIIPALATMYLGGYVANVDPKQTVSDVKNALNLVTPKLIFVEDSSVKLIEDALKDSGLNPEIIVIKESDKYTTMAGMDKEIEDEDQFRPIKLKKEDIAVIVFSSGTTSTPKGIYLSNSYLLNGSQGCVQHKCVNPGLVTHFSSLYWVSGWILTAIVIRTGTGKIIAPHLNAEKFLELVDKFKITYAFTSSTYTYQLSNLGEEKIKKYDTSSLNSLLIGGSPLDQEQLVLLRKLFPFTKVSLGYASSETNVIACFDFNNNCTEEYERKLSSSGCPLPEVEMKFIDLNTGHPVGPNQESEILIRSPYVMSGYHNLKKRDNYDKDGFLRIGDVGYYDEDGYVYVTDRISETFKYQTKQIAPSFIETVLLRHPDVAEAVVFGVPHTVDRYHPGSCIVLKNGAKSTVEEILDFANSRLDDPYKLRGGMMIVESLPKTPSEKIQRRTIRDLFIKLKKERNSA